MRTLSRQKNAAISGVNEALVAKDARATSRRHARRVLGRALIYLALIVWALIALFPIYWTVTTSFKTAVDVTQDHIVPWLQFKPDWRGWQSIGLSPDSIGQPNSSRDEFFNRFMNSLTSSIGASLIAVVIGSLAAHGLARFEYKWAIWRNRDISFFFLSQLILPPVALAMPLLVLYKELALLDTHVGLILVYVLMVLPIVIWIMRDQFMSIPVDLEQAAMVDGSSIWGAFFRIVLPLSAPGFVSSFILAVILCWNEYFFASLLTSSAAKTLPVLVASQTGSQGINWWSMAAVSTAAIAPLAIIGIILERYIVRGLATGAVK